MVNVLTVRKGALNHLVCSRIRRRSWPDVFPASGRNEPLVEKIRRQQIGIETCFLALGKERVQQEVRASHETHSSLD